MPTRDSETHLAPYAIHNAQSCGRRVLEGGHEFRQPFQRDRDRIIHSRAFRRLDGKTQVFLNGTGDHYRTRLTHTIEVAAIARTIARRLHLNEDLTEAIALAHDLGHTPFGHVGERILDRLLKSSTGGFDHNEQSLRIVDCLETKYPGVAGLNLTWEVRCGLIKHRENKPPVLDNLSLPRQASLEAQVADIADDLAYSTHDIDDGLEAGLIDDHALQSVTLWHQARQQALGDGAKPGSAYFLPYTVRCLIDMLVGNVIEHSMQQLAELRPGTPAEVHALPAATIGFTPEFADHTQELRTFLFENLYWHPDVTQLNDRVGDVVEDLFNHFMVCPGALGAGARQRTEATGRERAVADYISGMTDRFALSAWQNLTGKHFLP
jgi:dGTPase